MKGVEKLMTSPVESWSLIDQYHSIDESNEAQSVSIRSEEYLRELLEKARQGQPRLLILCHPGGHRLFVGIGGPFAGVLHYDNLKFVDGKFAVSRQQYAEQPAVFISEDCPTTFPAAALMPPVNVVELVCEFVKTGQIPSSASWVLARGLTP
jgi:hypothetical protein